MRVRKSDEVLTIKQYQASYTYFCVCTLPNFTGWFSSGSRSWIAQFVEGLTRVHCCVCMTCRPSGWFDCGVCRTGGPAASWHGSEAKIGPGRLLRRSFWVWTWLLAGVHPSFTNLRTALMWKYAKSTSSSWPLSTIWTMCSDTVLKKIVCYTPDSLIHATTDLTGLVTRVCQNTRMQPTR